MRSLSDTWHGRYAYPHSLPETEFVATVLDTCGLLAGAIHERRTHGDLAGQLLYASLDGAHHGGRVQFLKTYDPAPFPAPLPPVEYDGMIDAGGTEIAGTWRIGAHWSGSFVMVRAGRRAFAALRERQTRLVLTGQG